jgi:hypothetical protein
VVTSAAALLQSVAIRILGKRLSPAEMRSLLVSTGRAQTGANAATAPIGPLPQLDAATAALLASNPPAFQTTGSWGLFHLATETPDLNADVDKDGLPGVLEYLLGTDPKSSLSADAAMRPRLSAESLGAGAKQLVFEFNQPAARTGASWVVQTSTSLAPESWQDLIHGINGASVIRSGDQIRAAVPADPGAGETFFRLKAWVN